ncbi:MAG: hypothetical protein WCP69_10840 [Bacteroidota bacterium]
MNNKNSFKTIIIALLVLLSVLSCKKDEPDVVVDDRDAFVGTWNVSDNQITKANYQVRIYKDENNSEKVWLINFHGVIDTAFAYISTKTINISQQVIGSTQLSTAGSGLMNGTTRIDLEYYISDGAQQDTITAQYSK